MSLCVQGAWQLLTGCGAKPVDAYFLFPFVAVTHTPERAAKGSFVVKGPKLPKLQIRCLRLSGPAFGAGSFDVVVTR